MHSLELTNIDKSRVYWPAMNAWSNDKQRFRPPDFCPIVPIESGRASLSQPLHCVSIIFIIVLIFRYDISRLRPLKRLFDMWYYYHSLCPSESVFVHHFLERIPLSSCATPESGRNKYPPYILVLTWWRHQMETFSALLALCGWIYQSPVDSPPPPPPPKASDGILMFSFIYAWRNGWANTRDAGDLRRHRVSLWRRCND